MCSSGPCPSPSSARSPSCVFWWGLLGRGCETLSSYHLQMRLMLAGEEASTQLGLTLGNFVFLVQAGSSAQRAWSLWAAGLGWDFHASENHWGGGGEAGVISCFCRHLSSCPRAGLGPSRSLSVPVCPQGITPVVPGFLSLRIYLCPAPSPAPRKVRTWRFLELISCP